MQRTNVFSAEAMQKIVNSFKQVERKIDKLHEEVSSQGKALTDMRFMVASLSNESQNSEKHEEDARETTRRRRDKAGDRSHASSLRRNGPASGKVNKAKSYEPVILKTSGGIKRPLKSKKSEAAKKPASRSCRKADHH